MGLSPKQLGADEHEVIHTRTHAKALVLPALALIAIGGLVGAGSASIPTDLRPAGQIAVLALGGLLVIWWVLVPFLRWRTTTYTITTRRLITRHGILTKIGKDLPLNRIHEVSYERSVFDRMFGCGTINVQTAADDGTVILADVPEVQEVQRALTALLFASDPPQRSPDRPVHPAPPG